MDASFMDAPLPSHPHVTSPKVEGERERGGVLDEPGVKFSSRYVYAIVRIVLHYTSRYY